jgi:hypothetical protein
VSLEPREPAFGDVAVDGVQRAPRASKRDPPPLARLGDSRHRSGRGAVGEAIHVW